MSIFNELLPKITDLSNAYTKNFNDDLKVAFECIDEFEELSDHKGRSKTREKAQKDKNATAILQSINEDEDEPKKLQPVPEPTQERTSNETNDAASQSSSESGGGRRASKKRNKNEVEGMLSPEQDKRLKRNASVKAQSIISKQVNVNLTQKLRRENSTDKVDKNQSSQSSKSRRHKGDEKENVEPIIPVPQIKQEKVSMPLEPEMMETELPKNIEVKLEVNNDGFAMPPPAAPIPKPRKGVAKQKSQEEVSEEETGTSRRSTRTRKQTDAAPPPAALSGVAQSATCEAAAARPKRTRGRKKLSDAALVSEESAPASPAEKPRPKRTRRAQKAVEKELQKSAEPEPSISPKEERISHQEPTSPIVPSMEIKALRKKKEKTNPDIDLVKDKELTKTNSFDKDLAKNKNAEKDLAKNKHADKDLAKSTQIENDLTMSNNDELDNIVLNETRVISKAGEMDQTMVLPNGVYNHAPVTPQNIRPMNATEVIEKDARETIVLDKLQNIIMDATVVLDKGPQAVNVDDENSLITNDSDEIEQTPPKKGIPETQPASAVKEKVQQFEELASRVTRTKTRAMAKKEEETENHTPPDKTTKPVLSSETLSKMNSLIFNGKPPQISSSAFKPRTNTAPLTKSSISSSTSKINTMNKLKEAAEESLKREDARKKKEAMLEAKREQQKRKREEKMAAAAAAREASERSRRAAALAADRERHQKQAHADLGRAERLREAERKKLELARKVAETEERRRAEEAARRQRLADEQRRAHDQRKKQLEEQEATKKEAAMMAKEIEQKQREYIEKQKKQRLEDKTHTPFKTPGTPQNYKHVPMEPVYMEDGFQYLNSDEDEEPVARPIPAWSTSKSRRELLAVQSQISAEHVRRLFSVSLRAPDLRRLFPDIERARLKRTSSAVWRTPPHLPPLRE